MEDKHELTISGEEGNFTLKLDGKLIRFIDNPHDPTIRPLRARRSDYYISKNKPLEVLMLCLGQIPDEVYEKGLYVGSDGARGGEYLLYGLRAICTNYERLAQQRKRS